MSQIADIYHFSGYVKTTLDHINWGNTEMVYLATLTHSIDVHHLAVLINQPVQPASQIKEEFDHLQRLSDIDSHHIVKPIAFFQCGHHGLYAAPYVDKARCIYGGEGLWGMFDPKPYYHFEPFSPEVADTICASMIALLVRYYDHKNGLGISKTQLSGDDFILDQQWNSSDPHSVMDHMMLISARNMIPVSFNDYLNMLRNEFTLGTHYRCYIVKKGIFKINHKSELPMTSQVIEKGIQIGLQQ